MTHGEIHTRVVEIVRGVLEVETLEATDASTAHDMPGYDSIAHIQTLMECQRAFAIKFSALEAGQIENFGQLVKLVHDKVLALGS